MQPGLQRKSRKPAAGRLAELERKARFAALGRKCAKIPNSQFSLGTKNSKNEGF
jgi:hypothetical protein